MYILDSQGNTTQHNTMQLTQDSHFQRKMSCLSDSNPSKQMLYQLSYRGSSAGWANSPTCIQPTQLKAKHLNHVHIHCSCVPYIKLHVPWYMSLESYVYLNCKYLQWTYMYIYMYMCIYLQCKFYRCTCTCTCTKDWW